MMNVPGRFVGPTKGLRASSVTRPDVSSAAVAASNVSHSTAVEHGGARYTRPMLRFVGVHGIPHPFS